MMETSPENEMTGILCLPIEILADIVGYLRPRERNAVAASCKRLYQARSLSATSENTKLMITVPKLPQGVVADELRVPNVEFINRIARTIGTIWLHVDENNLEKIPQWDLFWEVLGPNVSTLTFYRCNMTLSGYVKIINKCPRLKYLEILEPAQPASSESDRDANAGITGSRLSMSTPSLTELHVHVPLSNVTGWELCNHVFTMLSECPNKLTSMVCRCSYRPQEECLKRLTDIHSFVASQRLSLRKLHLYMPLTEKHLLAITAIPGLKLQSLSMGHCVGLPKDVCAAVFRQQPNLIDVSIAQFRGIAKAVQSLAAYCPEIRRLHLEHYFGFEGPPVPISDIFALLCLFKQLEFLKLAIQNPSLCLASSATICQGLSEKLVHLNLSMSAFLNEEGLLAIAQRCRQLRCLHLNGMSSAVTDTALQAICRHSQKLTELHIARCYKVTDFGLTGSTDPSRRDCSADAGYSLAVLRRLNYLDLCNTSVTDVGVISAVRFTGLKELVLSMCAISDMALVSIAKHNKSLERIWLFSCTGITDDGVRQLRESLPFLKIAV